MRLKLAGLLAPFLIAASLLAAPLVQISVRGNEPADRDRVEFLANRLNFTHEPMIHYWQIVVLNKPDWQDALQRFHLEGQTETAFSVLQWDTSYVNGEYIRFSTDGEVKHTLAHEAGHFICECRSEDKANEIAKQLER